MLAIPSTAGTICPSAGGVESSSCHHSRNSHLFEGEMFAIVRRGGGGSINSEEGPAASKGPLSPGGEFQLLREQPRTAEVLLCPFSSRRAFKSSVCFLARGARVTSSQTWNLFSCASPPPLQTSPPFFFPGLLHQLFLIGCNYPDCEDKRTAPAFAPASPRKVPISGGIFPGGRATLYACHSMPVPWGQTSELRYGWQVMIQIIGGPLFRHAFKLAGHGFVFRSGS